MVAATSVARTWPRRVASRARSTRPPSMGNAGIRLNSARNRLTSARRSTSETLLLSTAARLWTSRCARIPTISTSAIATFTSGPAMAIRNSSLGFSGMRSSLATPPIGSRITSGVATPKARAVKMWPNSWASTQANSSTTKIRLPIAASGPPEAQPAAKIQTRNIRKVTWILIAVPAIEPIFTDHSMAVLQQANAFAPATDKTAGVRWPGEQAARGGDGAARHLRARHLRLAPVFGGIGLASIRRA